jgi:hypothetical protein
MASTYSALKIELIATGEQSGTWGTTTNTNLGDAALGEAITGSADVAFSSADVTVTLTDTNATQAARNLRLNLTGTSGGARSLILGSGCQIEKLYLVNNGLADAVTVKNTTGTGIAVAAGKSMFVYNNGTNVVDAVTHATSLTLGSALPVTSGGTGVTTSTGSGANALATSPTLVTPILGTPTSGTLTSCTGYTTANLSGSIGLTTQVTGTLPVANGGTGNATATAYAVLAGGTTSTGAFQSIASVGTTGQVLTSNGASALPTFQAAGGGFASGTRMSFQQTAAPTGWTKDTTAAINDSILRFVTGSVTPSGGSVAFSTWNAQTATGAYTLLTADMPAHTHTLGAINAVGGLQGGAQGYVGDGSSPTGSTGGGGAHSHTLTHNLKYYDAIIASKD